MFSPGANHIHADVCDATQVRLWQWVLWVHHSLTPELSRTDPGCEEDVFQHGYKLPSLHTIPSQYVVCKKASLAGTTCVVSVLAIAAVELQNTFTSYMQWWQKIEKEKSPNGCGKNYYLTSKFIMYFLCFLKIIWVYNLGKIWHLCLKLKNIFRDIVEVSTVLSAQIQAGR